MNNNKRLKISTDVRSDSDVSCKNNKKRKLTTYMGYVCIVHDHDKNICNIYECSGVKNILSLSRDVSYCK